MSVQKGDRVRVVNETGHGRDTKIFDAEGRDVTPALTGATVRLRVNDIARVDLEVLASRVNVEAMVDSITKTCPLCGHSEGDE